MHLRISHDKKAEFSHCSINNYDEHLYFYIDILETN